MWLSYTSMQRKLFFTWASITWVLIMLSMTPSLEAPLLARPGEEVKPLRVWTCLASWYGSKFEGRPTANGEKYDLNGLTVAHRSLPFGSILRVVNPRTGQGQVVRVNDRGPYVDGRGIDVSYRVAKRLGLEGRGLARVRVELLEVPPRH
jgi:rare lipoprotein A